MKYFEIYLSDLTERAQKQLIEFLGENGNYDVFPIITLTEEDESE